MMSAPTPLLPYDGSGIPELLRQQKRWAPWKATWKEDRQKWDKVPRHPSNPVERGLSTAKVESWVSYEAAKKAFEAHKDELAGLGYVMTGEHGIVGYDLDNCVQDGVVAEWAREVVNRVGSYCEWSPSGNGLRIFCRGSIPRDWANHDQGMECYAGHRPRFLTLTGLLFEDSPLEVVETPNDVHEDLMAKYAKAQQTAEVISIEMPDVLDEMCLPDFKELGLPQKVERFLAEGDHDGDRSAILHSSGVALYSKGLTDIEVFSMLVNNPFVFETALDKRRQDEDRAMLYLWKEHCLKARGKAVRMTAEDFEDVSTEGGPSSAPAPKPKPGFVRDKNGAIEATVDNVTKAVRSKVVIGMEIRRDVFKDEIVLSEDDINWRPFRDDDYTRLRVVLERQSFKPVSRELIRDAIVMVAKEQEFDTAIYWLEGLPAWDGTPRVGKFLADYFGAEDSPYTTAVSHYMWSAMAGRVLSPGVKADMAPILIGEQGAKKSSSIEALVPSHEFFTEMDIDERRESDNSRKMRGVLVAELAELKGLRNRESEYVKAFISRTHEEWIPKFREFASKFARRLIFIGTTNEYQFLNDHTGNRRFLPVVTKMADIEGIRRNRDQLWAEAREEFNVTGIAFEAAERLAKDVHAQHMIHEPWTDDIRKWLDTEEDFGSTPRDREMLTTAEVMREALRLDINKKDRWAEMRVGKALNELGYSRVKRRLEGKPSWVYVPT